jgi:hypothetical protein
LSCTTSYPVNPYESIVERLLSKLKYCKTPIESIYRDLPSNSNNKEVFKKIVESLKLMLLSDQNFDKNLILNQAKQIEKVFLYNDSKNGYNIFLENNKFLYENIFEIFIKTKRIETIYVLSQLRLDISQATSKLKTKFKEANAFNPWFLSKLSECARHIKKNWNYTDENQKNFIDFVYFIDFMRYSIYYINKEIKERSCAKPCLILAIDLLDISQDISNIDLMKFINDIFHKDNFYLLKDHQQETQDILKLLINLAVKIENNTNFYTSDTNNYNYLDTLKSCIKSFRQMIEQTRNSSENLKIIHNILFEKIIFEPVEFNYVSEDYFKLINDYMEFISYDYFPNDKKIVDKLKTVYQKAISDDILGSFVNLYDSEFRKKYYISFFKKLSEIIPKRQDISIGLTDEFIHLLEACMNKNEFLDPFNKDEFTVFYYFCEYLTVNVSKTESLNESLVDKCTEFWFQLCINLFEKDEFNSNLFNLFYLFLQNIFKNYKKLLSSKAEKLWNIYLEMKNEKILLIICEIKPLDIDFFLKDISTKFATLIIVSDKNYENPLSKNYIALIKLAESLPEFFFQSIPNRNINVIEIFECSKNYQNELIIAIDLIRRLFQTLSSQGLAKEFHDIAFDNRRKFHKILFVQGENKLKDEKRTIFNIPQYTLDIIVRILCDYYNFLASNSLNNEKIKILIDDLIELFEEMLPSKDAAIFLKSIEYISRCNNGQNKSILKEYHQYFLNLKKDNKLVSIVEIEISLNSIINYIEDKNIETFSKQLKENTSNISKLEKTNETQDLKIKKMNQQVSRACIIS